jgi:signal transduction histidine kinase/integral membrane sensor domain MASE1
MSPLIDRLRAGLRTRHRARGPLVLNLATAIACGAFGMLAAPLAIPPGISGAVQPVAGIALVLVLLLGRGVWPGILLGTFAASLSLPIESADPPAPLAVIALALAVGVGMALQAVVGDRLVRRFAGYPSTLAEGPDVLRFLALGGPVSSLIGATVSVLSALLLGRIPAVDAVFGWSTWWIASSLGAAFFAPLALLRTPGTLRAGLRRALGLIAPLATILALSVVLSLQVGAREREQQTTEFERRVDELANGLVRAFDASVEVLDSLGSFYDASDRIDRREFSTFARYALSRSSGVHSLAWCPRVKDSERSSCIRSGRLEVDPGYAILEGDGQGGLVAAAKRDEYVPVFYLESRQPTPQGLGFDATSDPDRRAALELARDRGEEVATSPAEVGEGRDRRLVFTVYRPVYGQAEPHGTPAERRTSLAGYASAEFCVEDMMRSALPGALSEGVQIDLREVTDGQRARPLHSLPSPQPSTRTARGTQRTTRYRIGGRFWELRFTPDAEAAPAHHAWSSWLVLLAGLLFTGLLESFLLVVTGRTDAIEQLVARRTLELERSNAELERFAYVASHDLQEPLRAVASHVQILEQDYRGRLDAEADESIRCAVEGARRMRDLIHDYLEYSRIRGGSEPLRATDSGEALRVALKNLEISIREAGADVASGEMPRVLADPKQLVPLFQNLVGNAVKFRGDAPPRIRVGAVREKDLWTFSVSDNGIGIEAEHTDRIFSMFRRLHTSDRYPGTGIGLAICKKIVDRHGGRIWVESKPGQGSTFCFTLPACPDPAEASLVAASERAGRPE